MYIHSYFPKLLHYKYVNALVLNPYRECYMLLHTHLAYHFHSSPVHKA